MNFLPLLLPYIFSFLILATVLYMQWLSRKRSKELEERNKRLTALRKVDEIMMSSTTDPMDVAQKVTDAVSYELGFEVGVLALIDKERNVLKRVAMSRTPTGAVAKKVLPFPYQQLEIPLDYEANLAIKAIKTATPQITHDLYDVFIPALDRSISQSIQFAVGVKTSLVYPLKARGKIIGVMIVSISRLESQLSIYEKESIESLIDYMGIAMDNALLYQSLMHTTAELEKANLRLKELDQLKDDFVSIASHELRTPMTAIRSYAWMALNKPDIPLSAKLKKYLERTLLSTERLINLVNDMLNVSRIESGRIDIRSASLDLQSLVQDVLSEVEVKASEKSIKLQAEYTNLPLSFADADKVHQVLLNLLGNALKFTPKSGTIKVSFFSDGHTIETSVKDSGVGISKEDLSKLFQKFGRLDNSYSAAATTGGTGLGLYISKSLIEKMGGKIWATSEGIGSGTTFHFSLPVATPMLIKNQENITANPNAKPLEPVHI